MAKMEMADTHDILNYHASPVPLATCLRDISTGEQNMIQQIS